MAQPVATGAPTAARMSAVVDMRRRGPEPPWAGPEIEFKPGMAREMLRERAPLLAEEGIHLDERGEFSDVDVPDLQTLQRALNRAGASRPPPPSSPRTPGYRPETGPANAPPPTCSHSPARAERSAACTP